MGAEVVDGRSSGAVSLFRICMYRHRTFLCGSSGTASLHEAVLPLTGLYFISVETTRGHGDYRLSFSYASHAPIIGTRYHHHTFL